MSHILTQFKSLTLSELDRHGEFTGLEVGFDLSHVWVEIDFVCYTACCKIALSKKDKNPIWAGKYSLVINGSHIEYFDDLSDAINTAKILSTTVFGAKLVGDNSAHEPRFWRELKKSIEDRI